VAVRPGGQPRAAAARFSFLIVAPGPRHCVAGSPRGRERSASRAPDRSALARLRCAPARWRWPEAAIAIAGLALTGAVIVLVAWQALVEAAASLVDVMGRSSASRARRTSAAQARFAYNRGGTGGVLRLAYALRPTTGRRARRTCACEAHLSPRVPDLLLVLVVATAMALTISVAEEPDATRSPTSSPT
jgi:hypothetical protein